MSTILSDFDEPQDLGQFIDPGHAEKVLEGELYELRRKSGLDPVDFGYYFEKAADRFRRETEPKHRFRVFDVTDFLQEVAPHLLDRVDEADVAESIMRAWNTTYLENAGITGQEKLGIANRILAFAELEAQREAEVPPLEPFGEVEAFDAGPGATGTHVVRICHVRGDGAPRLTLEPAGIEFELFEATEFIDALLPAIQHLRNLTVDQLEFEATQTERVGRELMAAMKEAGAQTLGDLMRIRQQGEGDVL